MESNPYESDINRIEQELEEWEKPKNKFLRALKHFTQDAIREGDLTEEEAERKLKQAEEIKEDFMDKDPMQAALEYLHDEEYKIRRKAKFDEQISASKDFFNKAAEIAKTNPRMQELLAKYDTTFKAYFDAHNLYAAEVMQHMNKVIPVINSNEFANLDELQEVPESPTSDDFKYSDQVLKASSSALNEIRSEMKSIIEETN